jgi:hypothetical protein
MAAAKGFSTMGANFRRMDGSERRLTRAASAGSGKREACALLFFEAAVQVAAVGS